MTICAFCAGTVDQAALRAELRAERLALGLKATWFAGELGISREVLCNFERGRNGISAKRYLKYRSILDRERLANGKGKKTP